MLEDEPNVATGEKAYAASLRLWRAHKAKDHNATFIDIAAVRRCDDVTIADHRSARGVADLLQDPVGRHYNPRIVNSHLVADWRYAGCRHVAIGNRAARQVMCSRLQ